MANEEQLAHLKQGAEHWNVWIQGRKLGIPDLAGADLRGLDLSEVILYNADLSGANLSGTLQPHFFRATFG
ncbi:hypothetical protein KSD_90130 [Ktedonobacter sp. SOSP1-85]|uniref:pentapeptide repeat-containing protein n=1 Tax=Ktedonobacter sp. SOSP1-85 TaxID=2778367 RepID=UPI0019157D55|nr:pentapeptide repeat-containing protein [Ktedonobacter sp. SOSP1-85]GHO81242.1 hypothetical protein KSD_90130 [Ktedonobacter sp. SOSP1-85]